jgi:phage-related minor tail protein
MSDSGSENLDLVARATAARDQAAENLSAALTTQNKKLKELRDQAQATRDRMLNYVPGQTTPDK